MQELSVVTPAELANGAAAHPMLDENGALVDPILLIDCDAPDHPRAVVAATHSRRILVGLAWEPVVCPLVTELDCTLIPAAFVGRDETPGRVSNARTLVGVDDPAASAGALVTAVSANPRAAVLLAALLRAGHRAPMSGLEAESLAYSTLLGGPEFRRWLGTSTRPAPAVTAVDPVLVRREEGAGADVLRITLNRPERRNAYGRELRDGLVAALEVARALREDGPTAAAGRSQFRVVLEGAGPCFCAGGDLAEFGTAPDPVTAHFVRTYAGAAVALLELSDCTEARLHGACVGAGVEMPAFARHVVAAPDTTFRLPEIGMGLVPGAGGTVSLPRRIGRWRTLYLALSGIELDMKTARAWGLVDTVAAVGTG